MYYIIVFVIINVVMLDSITVYYSIVSSQPSGCAAAASVPAAPRTLCSWRGNTAVRAYLRGNWNTGFLDYIFP